MSKLFYFKQFTLVKLQFSSIRLIDRALSGATIPGLTGSGSNVNEGVLRIPQSSSITEASPFDGLLSYQYTRCEGVYPSTEMKSV